MRFDIQLMTYRTTKLFLCVQERWDLQTRNGCWTDKISAESEGIKTTVHSNAHINTLFKVALVINWTVTLAGRVNGSSSLNLSLELKAQTETHTRAGNQVTYSDKCTDQENTQSLLLHLLLKYFPEILIPSFSFNLKKEEKS